MANHYFHLSHSYVTHIFRNAAMSPLKDRRSAPLFAQRRSAIRRCHKYKVRGDKHTNDYPAALQSLLLFASYSHFLSSYPKSFSPAAGAARVLVLLADWCIAQHKDVIKGPNFQIMYSSVPVDRNRGSMGRHAGRLILICNPNWRLTNSFDLPLEARARSAKKLIRYNHLLLS